MGPRTAATTGITLLRRAADPAFLLAAALALTGLLRCWDLGRRSAGLDFYQFWVVAQVAGRDDVPDVYAEEARSRLGAEFIQRSLTDEDSERRRVVAQPWQVLEPTATPLLYTAFRPLAGGTYEDDYRAFRALSLAAAAAGLLAIARLLGLGATPALLVLGLVAHSLQPLQSEIRVGNVNQLQLGALGAYLWLSSRGDRSRAQGAAGAILALLVALKPNLLPAVPVLAATWLVRRRRRKLALQAAGAVAGGAMAALLPLLTFGTLQSWPHWLAYLTSLPPAKIPLRLGNMGPVRLVQETAGLDLALPLGVAAASAVLACLWLGRSRAAEESPALDDAAAVSAGALVYLLSAPMVWLHYLLLALPAVLVLLRSARGSAPRATLAVAGLLALAVDPAALAFGIRELEQQAMVTSAGLLLLFALLCVHLARPLVLPAAGAAATISREARE